MALVQSGNNPFREPSNSQFSTPFQTPANTGSSAGPLNPSNTGASTNNRQPIIPEEAPPAYTPSPNVRQGEASLEHGPARPFQRNSNLNSNGSWSSYPGQRPGGPSSAPPPLPPRSEPPPNTTSEFAKDFYAVGGDVNISGASSSQTPDDGRPTSKPVPGHPLLNNGKLLVYPKGYTCEKCKNTGYKQNDPSHPCRKCWSKYGKIFAGALTYVSFSSNGESSMDDKNLQRPLPKFRPPQQSQFRPPPPPQQQPSFGPPPGPPQFGGDMPGSWSSTRGSFPGFGGGPSPRIQQISPWAPPPQNGPVYRPGDPRIGGRLCWRCDGDGYVSVFIFETDTCPICGGIGRVF